MRPLPAVSSPRRGPFTLLAGAVTYGVVNFVVPVSTGGTYWIEFVNRVALVTAALDTWKSTRFVPISTDAIRPGIEYPYFLLGNLAFDGLASFVSYASGTPPVVGLGVVLAASFALGTLGMFRLAKGAGLNVYLSAALGFLYAAGPYLSLNLQVRSDYPEYALWQALPALLLALRRCLKSPRAVLSVGAGAFTLAAPFYVHKLVAPYVVTTLVVLALGEARITAATVCRLGVIGPTALLLSVPTWLPLARGMDPARLRLLTNWPVYVLNPSLVNLLWPTEQNSLTAYPEFDIYKGHFALQVGAVPTIGLLACVCLVALRPGSAKARRLLVPLAVFLAFTAAVMGYLGVWAVAPQALRSIQFSYRLIGLPHFVGFVLLIGSLAALMGRVGPVIPRWALWVTGAALVVLAAALERPYWAPAAHSAAPLQAKAIQASDIDSHLYPYSSRSTLSVGFARRLDPSDWKPRRAIGDSGAVARPPVPIDVSGALASLILSGSVPQAAFAGTTDPVLVRVVALVGASHARVVLGESLVRSPTEAVVIKARLQPSYESVTIECARDSASGETAHVQDPSQACFVVNYLAAPNEGDEFVVPNEVPSERRTRHPLGRITIDARGLPPGHYLLPTFDYAFVRVTRGDGTRVPTYQFDNRPVVRHSERELAYSVSYDLTPEAVAVALAFAVFGVYALTCWALVRRGQR